MDHPAQASQSGRVQDSKTIPWKDLRTGRGTRRYGCDESTFIPARDLLFSLSGTCYNEDTSTGIALILRFFLLKVTSQILLLSHWLPGWDSGFSLKNDQPIFSFLMKLLLTKRQKSFSFHRPARMSPCTAHSPDLCSQRGRVGLADLQHSRTAREGGRCVFLTYFLGSLDNGKKAAFACVRVDLGCHGLSPCVVPGEATFRQVHVAQWELSERLCISELRGEIGSLRRVLLPGSAKEAKTCLTAHCTKADVRESDLIQSSE